MKNSNKFKALMMSASISLSTTLGADLFTPNMPPKLMKNQLRIHYPCDNCR
jgi:hypothetical protein